MKEDNSSSFCLVNDDTIFCPAAQNRDGATEVDRNYLANLIAEAADNDVRNILIKINLRESFEVIFNKIKGFKQSVMLRTLLFLYGDEENKVPDDMKKLKSDGVTLLVLKRLFSLFSHKCGGCQQWVENNRFQEPYKYLSCKICQTRACQSCFKDVSSVTK